MHKPQRHTRSYKYWHIVKNTVLAWSAQQIISSFSSVYICVFRSFAQFNFVGRILGPRGLTAKQLEAETGCKIMVRGKGSMRDKKKVNAPSNAEDTCVLSSHLGLFSYIFTLSFLKVSLLYFSPFSVISMQATGSMMGFIFNRLYHCTKNATAWLVSLLWSVKF